MNSSRTALCVARLALLLAALVLFTGCSADRATDVPLRAASVVPPRAYLAAAIVANPVALVGGAAPQTTYISLPPGTLPSAQAVDIVNMRTIERVHVDVTGGGFDPVGVGSATGDTIELRVRPTPPTADSVYIVVVPPSQRPRVVRTDPPDGKRDVPLSARLVVVFSEPMDTTAMRGDAIVLRTDDTRIAGHLTALDAERLRFAFTPAAPLAVNTAYQLTVQRTNRDLDGESLGVDVVASFVSAPQADAAILPGRLAFHAWTEAFGHGVYTMRPDGSQRVRLTTGMDPDWSPDGARIAFWRWGGGVYTMRADGSDVRLINAHGYQPSWSPDGQRIAFGCGGICVMNADGSGVTELTPFELPTIGANDRCIRDSDPDWSSTGVIAFTRWPVAGPEHRPFGNWCVSLGNALNFPFDFWTAVWSVRSDGADERLVSTEIMYAGWPAWSPDGSRLAFYASGNLNQGHHIFVRNADASGGTSVAHSMQFDLATLPSLWSRPAWSPDGDRLLHSRGNEFVFAGMAPGAPPIVVTAPPVGTTWNTSWSWSRQ